MTWFDVAAPLFILIIMLIYIVVMIYERGGSLKWSDAWLLLPVLVFYGLMMMLMLSWQFVGLLEGAR